MKNTTLWIIRLALTVQFVSVLAVPTLLAASEAPQAMWMAEWVRPQSGRTIGILTLRSGRLAFTEQVGQVDWDVDLANVRRVATANDGRALVILSNNGDEYVAVIMEANMTPQSPKRAVSTIERAMQLLSANSR
jgi:hypothetical protein